jgi:hypothetical protein
VQSHLSDCCGCANAAQVAKQFKTREIIAGQHHEVVAARFRDHRLLQSLYPSLLQRRTETRLPVTELLHVRLTISITL